MRTSIALAVLTALFVASNSASAKGLRSVGTAASRVAADGRSGVVAYLASPGSLAVLRDSGQTSEFAIPSDCVPMAAASDAVGLGCGFAMDSPELLTVADGERHAISIDGLGAERGFVVGIGTDWIELEAATPPAANGHYFLFRALVNRTNGDKVDLRRDPFGVASVIDLNRASAHRRLCRPHRRTRTNSPAFDHTRYLPASLFGSWFAESAEARIRVSRCGSKRHRASFSKSSRIVLNRRFAAHRSGSAIRLVNLRTRRYRTLRFAPGAQPVPSLSAGRLYVRTSDGELSRLDL